MRYDSRPALHGLQEPAAVLTIAQRARSVNLGEGFSQWYGERAERCATFRGPKIFSEETDWALPSRSPVGTKVLCQPGLQGLFDLHLAARGYFVYWGVLRQPVPTDVGDFSS